MRLVFLGTPEDAVPPLRALVAAGHEVALVVTQPDRKRGRGGALVPSPVRATASELGLPVLTPARAGEVVEDVRASGADLGVIVAFGQLLPPSLLGALPLGFVNLHFSLLPRWRGAAPVERAILAGDAQTGVCVMAVEAALDAGPVYARASTPIDATETAGELRARLVTLGTDLLVRTLPVFGTASPESQTGEPTYAAKLTVEEFRLDLARPAAELLRVIRAGNPRPGAWLDLDGKRLKVLAAHVEAGQLVPDVVQPEGRGAMSIAAWRAGYRGPDPFG
ncbi:MAG: methionyl-tRNA formyltransferase [Actinobacteria bacterium]|nr:methionyl-tRNA formyltransferase [Actinomycetota bacterium]